MSTLKMLIKFLYNEFKYQFLKSILPFYIVQLLIYESSVHYLEKYFHTLYENKNLDGIHLDLNEKSAE